MRFHPLMRDEAVAMRLSFRMENPAGGAVVVYVLGEKLVKLFFLCEFGLKQINFCLFSHTYDLIMASHRLNPSTPFQFSFALLSIANAIRALDALM